MKVYIFFTESHRFFMDDWFLPSIKMYNPTLEIDIKEYEQKCETATLNTDGWIETMHFKIDTIIRGIEENMGSSIIHSDIDIQFFGDILPDITKGLEDKDVVFQKGGRTICMGFLACNCNDKTLAFFKIVKEEMTRLNKHDEFCAKQLLNLPAQLHDDKKEAARKYKNTWITWAYLPDNKFIGGKQVAESTAKGKFKPVPKGTVMHHATCTVFKYKTKQMDYVKTEMNKLLAKE
jgi:hypothetical protein